MIDGFQHFPEFWDRKTCGHALAHIRSVLLAAPWYQPTMPRTGKPLSVRMSNCGSLGWVSDKVGGYRYQATHPITGCRWPPISELLMDVWQTVVPNAPPPEACLINYYAPNARMGSHRDMDEDNITAPVVSISLGDDAIFHIGGLKRSDTKTRLTLHSGDVVVLGGKSRLAYHGVNRILSGTSDLLPEQGRINLTLRRVTMTNVQ